MKPFSGKVFEIPHLSTDPKGFEVKSVRELRRLPDGGAHTLTSAERETLKAAYLAEGKFQGREKLRKLKAVVASCSTELADARMAGVELEAARKKYVASLMGKLGIRNVTSVGNSLRFDTKLIGYPAYSVFATPNDSSIVSELSRLSGSALILLTSDGKIILQHRSSKNMHYGDIPGASVAGMSEAPPHAPTDAPGTTAPITTATIINILQHEAEEELGIRPEEFQCRITGIGTDYIKIHDEFLALGTTSLSSEELKQRARSSSRNRKLSDTDFEEKFLTIPGTPDAIVTLLTEVQTPIPPTHIAAFVAAGYTLVLESKGMTAADDWKVQLERKFLENFDRMESVVKHHYGRFPEAQKQIPLRFLGKRVPPRNLESYSTAYLPIEQGLPGAEDELVRVGLIEETRTILPDFEVFDIDGVLSDLAEGRPVVPEVIQYVADKLAAGIPIGLNTGRSLEWVQRIVEQEIRRYLADPAAMSNLIVVGEKGGAYKTFNSLGEGIVTIIPGLGLSPDFLSEVEKLSNSLFPGYMSILDPKHTMVSLEKNKGVSLADYTSIQPECIDACRALVARFGLQEKFKVDGTTIAVDIESPLMGKSRGIEIILTWLESKNVKPLTITTYGDSSSDIEMAEEALRRGISSKHVHVGEKEIRAQTGIELVRPTARYVEGTLECLKGRQ